jgi:hypothetical protein
MKPVLQLFDQIMALRKTGSSDTTQRIEILCWSTCKKPWTTAVASS